MRPLLLIPNPSTAPALRSDDEGSSYSLDDEAPVEQDVFETAASAWLESASARTRESPLLSSVRKSIAYDDIESLQALLADENVVRNINEPRFNAMDVALYALLRDKQSVFIPKVVALLKEKGAVPKSMKEDAKYWCNELKREAERRLTAAKLINFETE